MFRNIDWDFSSNADRLVALLLAITILAAFV
jgi:uncharacterized membrane protein